MFSVVAPASRRRTVCEDQTIQTVMPSSSAHMEKKAMLAQMITGRGELLGYFVAMKGVDEVHLLNITVAPEYQGQGWARVMLDSLGVWARGQGALWLWLEVRVHNARAIQVYEAHGFRRVGMRKAYYPADRGQREDAIVMSLALEH